MVHVALAELKWPLSKGDTKELIEQIERHKSTCILALSTDNGYDAQSYSSSLNATLSYLGRIFAGFSASKRHPKIYWLKSGPMQVRCLLLRKLNKSVIYPISSCARTRLTCDTEGDEIQRLFRWLSSFDPSTNHQTARDLYHDGTGQWVFDVPEFVEWIGTMNSGLWIYGIPGAGKTILSSLIIETLFEAKGTGVAYYYCDYKSAVSQDPLNVLGSLATQLVKQNAKTLHEAQEFYNLHHPKRLPPKRPNEESLGRLLQRLSMYFSSVTLIIDGLDECGAASGIDRSALVKVLSQLHNAEVGSIRTMIASREEVDIGHRLTNFAPVSIAARSADLELYVAAEVSRRSEKLRFRDKGLRVEVIETLIEGARGMYAIQQPENFIGR